MPGLALCPRPFLKQFLAWLMVFELVDVVNDFQMIFRLSGDCASSRQDHGFPDGRRGQSPRSPWPARSPFYPFQSPAFGCYAIVLEEREDFWICGMLAWRPNHSNWLWSGEWVVREAALSANLIRIGSAPSKRCSVHECSFGKTMETAGPSPHAKSQWHGQLMTKTPNTETNDVNTVQNRKALNQ